MGTVLKFLCNSTKPNLNADKPVLCDFRSSKAYLWGLVRDRLDATQSKVTRPLHILDAACHALITRDMFPKLSLYYGLDIASSRLSAALQRKRTNDVLYRADLSRDVSLDSMFDVVVSCNTMSHLPSEQQEKAILNLISSCSVGGDLFVNFTICQDNMFFAHRLLAEFSTLEPIYFDSFLSHQDESSGAITAENINSKITSNEINIPNEASLHRQVLFHAQHRLAGVNRVGEAPRIGEKIITLSSMPSVSILKFADDVSALQKLDIDIDYTIVVFTPSLFGSDYGISLRQSLSFKVHRLDQDLALPSAITKVVIFGLEKGWIDEGASDRLAINRLKEKSDISVVFAIVKSRDNQSCFPSVVALDF